MKRIVLIALLLPLFIFGCKKKEANCEDTETFDLKIEENVQVGWPLRLYLASNNFEYIELTLPSGEIMKVSYTEFVDGSYYVITDSATTQHSGQYKVSKIKGSCTLATGVKDVQILPISNPPCNPTINTSTSTIGGLGNENYTFVYKEGTGGSSYLITGETANAQLIFAFNGTTPPKPGLYFTLTQSGYFPSTDDPKEVAITYSKGIYSFHSWGDQFIYVNYVNGNIELTMCSQEFINTVSSSPLLITGKLAVIQ